MTTTTLGRGGDFLDSPGDLSNHYDYLGSPSNYIYLTIQVVTGYTHLATPN